MNKVLISLLAGAGALMATSAQAAPISPVAPVLDSGVENVRLICNEWGRCWRQRGPRIVYGDSYNYYGGYGRPYGYRHYDRGPGVHFNAPGISFGIGGGRW